MIKPRSKKTKHTKGSTNTQPVTDTVKPEVTDVTDVTEVTEPEVTEVTEPEVMVDTAIGAMPMSKLEVTLRTFKTDTHEYTCEEYREIGKSDVIRHDVTPRELNDDEIELDDKSADANESNESDVQS